MSERIKPTIIDSLKRPFKAIGEIFESRDDLVAQQEEREARLDALGGIEGVRTMPLHDIEEAMGFDDFPWVDKYGGMYPSRNEQRKESAKNAASLNKWVVRGEEVPLFERIQGHFVQKARNKQ